MQQQRDQQQREQERMQQHNTLTAFPRRPSRSEFGSFPPNGAPAELMSSARLRYPPLGGAQKSILLCVNATAKGSASSPVEPTWPESLETVRARSLRPSRPAKADRTRPAPQAVQNGSCSLSEGPIEGQRWSCAPPTRREKSSSNLVGSQVWAHSVPDRCAQRCLPARAGSALLVRGLRNPYRSAQNVIVQLGARGCARTTSPAKSTGKECQEAEHTNT